MFNSTEKVLWYLIALAGAPYAFLLMFNGVNWDSVWGLFIFVVLFDWFFIPLYFFRGGFSWWKKAVSIGVNLVLVTAFINLSGGADSIFYPYFYYLPLLVACIYGGIWESLSTAVLAAGLTVSVFQWRDHYDALYMTGFFLTFFLVAAILGYVISKEKKQRRENETMARQLRLAYEELSSSHQQLQAYTELMEDMNDEMEQLAVTDELTLLYNYRYFQSCLEYMLKQRHNHPVSLIMLDIDHFKKVNDRWGHQAGNTVLAKLADIIRQQVRDADVVVRYGGEEFAVILPGTNPEGVYMVAERIRAAVEKTLFNRSDEGKLRVTVSLGVTTYPLEAGNKSELISNADKAMYRAKELGRNRVIAYREILSQQQEPQQ